MSTETTETTAQKVIRVRVALSAADSYGDELMRELGLEPPFEPTEETHHAS